MHAPQASWETVGERVRVLQQLRAAQIGLLLVLLLGVIGLSLAPSLLVLTLGFLALTFGLLGGGPLLLAKALENT
jgi:hypothetical protein